jgi:hypothetical protein
LITQRSTKRTLLLERNAIDCVGVQRVCWSSVRVAVVVSVSNKLLLMRKKSQAREIEMVL